MLSKLLYSLIAFQLFICTSSSNAFAFESHWNDYREPLTKSMKTCLEGDDYFVSVNLPAAFLRNHKKIQLSLTFKSKTYSQYQNGNKTTGFYGYSPFVKINDSFFSGYYHLNPADTPARQEYLLEVDSDDFTPGKNIIKLGFSNDAGGKGGCLSKCCPCIFEELEFLQAEFPMLNISVTSSPEGSSVYVNNTYKGTTPLGLSLREKDYWLRVEKEGYEKQYKKVHVSSNKTHFQYKMKADGLTVSVKTNVAKANLYIDGKFIGTTPLSTRLQSKSYQFEFKKKGYTTKKKTISISSNNKKVSVDLQTIVYLLVIESNQQDVDVFIDGKLKGKTPLNVEVKPGKLDLKLVKSGFQTIATSETISQGKVIKYSLVPEITIPVAAIPIPITAAPVASLPVQKAPKKVTVQTATNAPEKFGKYYGLIVGNNNYKHLKNLKTATNDAKVFSRLLEKHYGFSNTILIDASRKDILLAFQHYREILTNNDNLLIYFAGHGWLDTLEEEGYWLPVDAEESNKLNWVSNSSITATLRALQARHVLIIADSCYSGTLTRGIKPVFLTSPSHRNNVMKKRSRSAITSGGMEPVSDSGIFPDHSIFAQALINLLQDNTGVMDATELFSKIRRPVILNSDQTPDFSDIKKAGHNGGEFFFVRQ